MNKSGIVKTLLVGFAVALTLSSTTQRLTFAADWKRESRSASAQIDELRRQNELLKSRLDGFEKRFAFSATGVPGPSRVQAPFEVVDIAGRVVFQVTAKLGSQVPDSLRGRVQIARGSFDNYVLTIRRPDGTVSAAMAEAQAGYGSLQLRDASGNERVRLDGDGGIRLFGPNAEKVGSFGFKAGNAARGTLQLSGLLQIFDGAGETMVEAGTSPNEVGVVKVGPGAKCVPLGTLRVPDCIMGRRQ